MLYFLLNERGKHDKHVSDRDEIQDLPSLFIIIVNKMYKSILYFSVFECDGFSHVRYLEYYIIYII